MCVCVYKYRYRVRCRRIRQVLRYHCVTVCIYDMDNCFPVDVDVRTCMQMYYTYDVRTISMPISMHYTKLSACTNYQHALYITTNTGTAIAYTYTIMCIYG